jgi:hypothetical protein
VFATELSQIITTQPLIAEQEKHSPIACNSYQMKWETFSCSGAFKTKITPAAIVAA